MFSHVLEVRSFLNGGLHTLKIVILKVFLAGEKESKLWAYHRNAACGRVTSWPLPHIP